MVFSAKKYLNSIFEFCCFSNNFFLIENNFNDNKANNIILPISTFYWFKGLSFNISESFDHDLSFEVFKNWLKFQSRFFIRLALKKLMLFLKLIKNHAQEYCFENSKYLIGFNFGDYKIKNKKKR